MLPDRILEQYKQAKTLPNNTILAASLRERLKIPQRDTPAGLILYQKKNFRCRYIPLMVLP
jgi:hypothetical protein